MIVIFILKSTNAKYDDKSANNIKINKTMLTCIIKEYQNTRRNTRAQRKHSKNQCHNGITLPISKTEDTNYLKNNNNKKPTQLRILHLPKKSTKCKSRHAKSPKFYSLHLFLESNWHIFQKKGSKLLNMKTFHTQENSFQTKDKKTPRTQLGKATSK